MNIMSKIHLTLLILIPSLSSITCVPPKNDAPKSKTQMFWEDLEKYTNNLKFSSTGLHLLRKECITQEWFYAQDSSRIQLSDFKERETYDLIDSTLLEYRVDAIFIYYNTITIRMIYSTPLTSNFCRIVESSNRSTINLTFELENFYLVYSSEQDKPPVNMNMEVNENKWIWSWNMSQSRSISIDSAHVVFDSLLKDKIDIYDGINEKFLDGDSLNRLLQ